MVCQKLDELERDFLQARAESQYLDSLGWTDREFSCLHAMLDHKREGHQGESCAGIKHTQEKAPMPFGGRSPNWDTTDRTCAKLRDWRPSCVRTTVETIPVV
jgi:hypothetical protein